jgi:hypothetical protein
MKSVFDDQKRYPIDRLARDVTSGGVHFTRDEKQDPRDQRQPYPTRPVPLVSGGVVAASLVGKRYGRMQIIGLARDVAKRWVVRCSCGMYALRRFASITNSSNNNDCCGQCRYAATIAAKHASSALGRTVLLGDLPGMISRGGHNEVNGFDQGAVRMETLRATPGALKLARMTKEQRRARHEAKCRAKRRTTAEATPMGQLLLSAVDAAAQRSNVPNALKALQSTRSGTKRT